MADVTFTFSGDASDLQNALNEIKGEIGKTKESVKGLAGQFAATFAAIGAAIAAVKGAFSTLGGISAEAARMEQTGLAFKVMMGDAAAAAEYVEKLRVYAAETPFEFGDISDAGKTLLSMGTAAEKSIEVIRKLGDIASVSGKPLKDLAFLYAKVQNSGLSNEVAESLEMQGVPIRKLIAEMKGISFEDVFKGISKRQFNLDDLDAALDKLTGPGGLLENMTKLQSQTFSGALSTLTDGFSALAVEIGTPINAAILPVLADLTAYVDSLTPSIQQFGQILASIFEGTVSVITPIVSGIGELVSILGGAETVIAAAAAAMLMYVGNTKTATTSTVSFRTQLVAMGNTIKGLSFSSFVTAYRPVSFMNSESNMLVECDYDSMGRRICKKVSVNDAVTLHHRYIYRGYLLIACIDLLRSHRPVLWFITWEPSQPIASRPLAIQKDGTWYTYGWDLAKNICEIFNKNGYIGTQYTYTPFGITTTSGSVVQPVRHSSEVFDEEIGLTAFPLRYYNPLAARWINRDPALENGGYNLYSYVDNSPIVDTDFLGMFTLSKTVKNMLKNLGGAYDAKNDCKEFSTEAITKESPFFPILGIPTRLKFTGELAFKCCCDGKRIRNYLETSLNLELFMQIGYIKRKRDYYNLPRKRRRKMSKPGYIQRGIGNVPSAGASEMGNNASLSYKNLEKCPTERFELFDVDVYIFLRGAVGAWMGVYGDVTFNILGNEYVDENSVWSRFEASGGVAFGIYGASLAFGVGGSVSAKLLL